MHARTHTVINTRTSLYNSRKLELIKRSVERVHDTVNRADRAT